MTTDGCLTTVPYNKVHRTTYAASKVKVIDFTMSLPFSTPPSTATASLTPFKAIIPEAKLVELETLIKLAKLAPTTYENSRTDGRYGVTTDWLVAMRDQWLGSYHWY
jgi:Epoxide hydrolase N terminus.